MGGEEEMEFHVHFVLLIRTNTSSVCALPLALSIASVTALHQSVEQDEDKYTIIEPIGKTPSHQCVHSQILILDVE